MLALCIPSEPTKKNASQKKWFVESRLETWKWTRCLVLVLVKAQFAAKRAIKFSAWCSLSGRWFRARHKQKKTLATTDSVETDRVLHLKLQHTRQKRSNTESRQQRNKKKRTSWKHCWRSKEANVINSCRKNVIVICVCVYCGTIWALGAPPGSLPCAHSHSHSLFHCARWNFNIFIWPAISLCCKCVHQFFLCVLFVVFAPGCSFASWIYSFRFFMGKREFASRHMHTLCVCSLNAWAGHSMCAVGCCGHAKANKHNVFARSPLPLAL